MWVLGCPGRLWVGGALMWDTAEHSSSLFDGEERGIGYWLPPPPHRPSLRCPLKTRTHPHPHKSHQHSFCIQPNRVIDNAAAHLTNKTAQQHRTNACIFSILIIFGLILCGFLFVYVGIIPVAPTLCSPSKSKQITNAARHPPRTTVPAWNLTELCVGNSENKLLTC